MNNIQAAFNIIEKLAAISATPGINPVTIGQANEHIQKLMNTIVKKEIDELISSSSKLIL